MLGLDTIEQPSSPACPTMHSAPLTEPGTIFGGAYQPAIETTQSVSEPRHTNEALNVHSNEFLENLGPASSDQQILSNPDIERIAHVFPPYLCSSITKTGGTASMSMAHSWFPNEQFTCLVSLNILPSKIQHIAMALFGIHLDSDENIWYIIQENGGRISFEKAKLEGAQDMVVKKLLGSQVHHAIVSSPMRKEELRQAILATRCVTLQISGRSFDDGFLNLELDIEGWFQIKDLLF